MSELRAIGSPAARYRGRSLTGAVVHLARFGGRTLCGRLIVDPVEHSSTDEATCSACLARFAGDWSKVKRAPN